MQLYSENRLGMSYCWYWWEAECSASSWSRCDCRQNCEIWCKLQRSSSRPHSQEEQSRSCCPPPWKISPCRSQFVSLVSQLATYFLTDKRLTFNGLLLRFRTRAGGGVVVGGCLRVSFLMQFIDEAHDRKAIKIQRTFIIRVFLFAKCSRSSRSQIWMTLSSSRDRRPQISLTETSWVFEWRALG